MYIYSQTEQNQKVKSIKLCLNQDFCGTPNLLKMISMIYMIKAKTKFAKD